LGKSVHLNRPGKKHNSGFGLPPIAVTKNLKKQQQKTKKLDWCHIIDTIIQLYIIVGMGIKLKSMSVRS